MWVKGVLSPERLPEPLQRATLVIESAALCLAFCVRVSRERRYGLLATGTAMDVRGTPVSKSIAIVFGRPRVSLLIAVAALSMPKNPAIDEVPKAHGSIVLGKLLDSKDVNYGYDAQKGEFTDLVQAGIIDPTKVVRHALQDAASVAGLLITTEAMVAEKPEPKSAMPAMPPGGGMGGMDF